MSLITRCPDCATLFKVVPDQLRISGGWVRCGHCNHVFDATLNMVASPEGAGGAQATAPTPAPATRPTPAPATTDGQRPAPSPESASTPSISPSIPPASPQVSPSVEPAVATPATMPMAPSLNLDAFAPHAAAAPRHAPPAPAPRSEAGLGSAARSADEPVAWQTLWHPDGAVEPALGGHPGAADDRIAQALRQAAASAPRATGHAAEPPAEDAPNLPPAETEAAAWIVSAPVPIETVPAPLPAPAVPWSASELRAWGARRRAEREGVSEPVPPEPTGSVGAMEAASGGGAAAVSPAERPDAAAGRGPGRPTSWSEGAPLMDGHGPEPAAGAPTTPPAQATVRPRPPGRGVDFLLSGVGEAGGAEPGATAALEPTLPPYEAPLSPSFVRAARRRAFWSARPVRYGLFAGLLLLVLALAVQMALTQRDQLAAREPGLAPLLTALCQPLGCAVRPYRQLDAVVIDSSAFNRADADTFRFSVSLRNRAELRIATPSLELTLTDLQDQPLVRRVLSPEQLGAPATLGPKDEFSTTQLLTLSAAARPAAVSNYRLVAFYP